MQFSSAFQRSDENIIYVSNWLSFDSLPIHSHLLTAIVKKTFMFHRKTRAGTKAVSTKDRTTVECKWISCHLTFQNTAELSEHVKTAHVEPMATQDVFVCLWEGCKVFDKPSLSHSWLTKHVNIHTGAKPFKCMISGCSLTFSSREGLARHVPSHFNDSKPAKRQKTDNDSSPKKLLKRKKKKVKVLRQARPPVQGGWTCCSQNFTFKTCEKLCFTCQLVSSCQFEQDISILAIIWQKNF